MDTPSQISTENWGPISVPEPTPRQIKAARHYFGWSQPGAAQQFGIYVGTLRDLEAERYSPKTTTLRAIGAALTARGVLFSGDGSMVLPR